MFSPQRLRTEKRRNVLDNKTLGGTRGFPPHTRGSPIQPQASAQHQRRTSASIVRSASTSQNRLPSVFPRPYIHVTPAVYYNRQQSFDSPKARRQQSPPPAAVKIITSERMRGRPFGWHPPKKNMDLFGDRCLKRPTYAVDKRTYTKLTAATSILPRDFLVTAVLSFIHATCVGDFFHLGNSRGPLNPFRTAVSLWEQLGTNYLEFRWCFPKTGLEF